MSPHKYIYSPFFKRAKTLDFTTLLSGLICPWFKNSKQTPTVLLFQVEPSTKIPSLQQS